MGICGQTLELIDAFGISFQLYHVRGALGALVVPEGQGGRPALLGEGQGRRHFKEGEDKKGQPQGGLGLIWSHIHN